MDKSVVRVHINDIEVGSLPAMTYQDIVQSVKRDPRFYLAVAWDAFAVPVRMLRMANSSLPWFLVCVVAWAVIMEPAAFTQFIANVRTSDPADITTAIRKALSIIVTAEAIFILCLGLIYPGFFGFKSTFNELVFTRVRKVLKLNCCGEMKITFGEN